MCPKEAEAISFREALSWLCDKHLDNVVIKTDAQQIVMGLHGVKDSSYTGLIIDDCLYFLKHFSNLSFYFVRKSTNIVAHECARAALCNPSLQEWESPLDFSFHVLSN